MQSKSGGAICTNTTIWLYYRRVKGRMSRSNAKHGNLHGAPERPIQSETQGRLSSGTVLTSPPRPMLAQLETRLPGGDHWAYEPNDGRFARQLWRRESTVAELLSRSGRGLGPWFPRAH